MRRSLAEEFSRRRSIVNSFYPHCMKHPDDQIARAVAAFQQGIDREQNFRFLFDRHYVMVQRFFAKRVNSVEDRLDLTQETFLRVYKGLEGYRGEARFGTWLFRIAFNTHLKWLRRAKLIETAEGGALDTESTSWDDHEPVAVDPQATPLEETLENERRLKLHEAIEALPEQMRRCAEMRLYEGKSYSEIAAVMRLSIETVKVHLFQARKKLKEALQESFAESDL